MPLTLENPVVIGAAEAYERHMGWDLEPADVITVDDVMSAAAILSREKARAANTGFWGEADRQAEMFRKLVLDFGCQCARTGDVEVA